MAYCLTRNTQFQDTAYCLLPTLCLMGRVGLEPTLELIQMVFETIASTDSATSPDSVSANFKDPHSSFQNQGAST